VLAVEMVAVVVSRTPLLARLRRPPLPASLRRPPLPASLRRTPPPRKLNLGKKSKNPAAPDTADYDLCQSDLSSVNSDWHNSEYDLQ
jgi:hypothetical protein